MRRCFLCFLPTRVLSLVSLVSLLLLSGCLLQRFQDEGLPLRAGIRVEMEGTGEELVARDIQEKEFEKPLEVTGPVQVADFQPSLLGVPVLMAPGADYEDADKEPTDPFDLTDGEWFKLKGDVREDGTWRVRKIRRSDEQPRWEVEGVVTAVDPADPPRWLEVGPYHAQIQDDTKVELQDPRRVWQEFLREGPLGRRASKEQRFVPYTIPLGERARLGGQVGVKYKRKDNYNLNADRRRDKDDFQGLIKLSTLLRVGENGLLVAQANAKHDVTLEQEKPNEDDLDIEPTDFYLFLPDLWREGLHLQVGRQDLDDRREWLYDERVDAVRLYYQRSVLEFEASVSRTPRLLNTNDRTPSTNLVGVISWRPEEDWVLSTYVVDRRTNDLDEFSPFHYGVRSLRKQDLGLSHWVELSRADGLVQGRRLRGYAVDVGGTWVVDRELEPSVTVGYALGSGGRRSGKTDRTYRQTGLQDNNDKWNGVTSFRYYGEVFDPELTNLQVLTAGVGIRPTRQSSLDLVGHSYRQDVRKAGSLRSDLRAPANGVNAHLGEEVDLILGYRGQDFTWELVGGAFWPGHGFDQNNTAYGAAFQVRFKF